MSIVSLPGNRTQNLGNIHRTLFSIANQKYGNVMTWLIQSKPFLYLVATNIIAMSNDTWLNARDGKIEFFSNDEYSSQKYALWNSIWWSPFILLSRIFLHHIESIVIIWEGVSTKSIEFHCKLAIYEAQKNCIHWMNH